MGGFHLGTIGNAHVDGLHGRADICYGAVYCDIGDRGAKVKEGGVYGGEDGGSMLGSYYDMFRRVGGV